MTKLKLLKAIRAWNYEHGKDFTLETAKATVKMLEDIDLIYFEIGGDLRWYVS